MAYVTFPSATVLSADIPPGARLDLNPGRQIALRHRTRDAFYSDYSLQPEPAHRQPLLDAALTHANIGARRVVYWGFELTDIVNRPWDRAIARLLVRNSVAWAAQEPVRDRRALAARQTRGSIDRPGCGSRVRQRAIRCRFSPCRWSPLDVLPHVGARRALRATVASSRRIRRDRNAWRESSLARRSARRGTAPRLATTQREFAQVVGSEVNGLRPPEEQFDTATMSAWLAAKGNYLFGANDSRAAAPGTASRRSGHAWCSWDAWAATISPPSLAAFTGARHAGVDFPSRIRARARARRTLRVELPLAGIGAAGSRTGARRGGANVSLAIPPCGSRAVGDVAEWWRVRAQLTARAVITGVECR